MKDTCKELLRSSKRTLIWGDFTKGFPEGSHLQDEQALGSGEEGARPRGRASGEEREIEV